MFPKFLITDDLLLNYLIDEFYHVDHLDHFNVRESTKKDLRREYVGRLWDQTWIHPSEYFILKEKKKESNKGEIIAWRT